MVKIIAVCSGKGGVGKTSIAINLGAALQMMNKRTVLVDCNLTTSHLGLLFDLYKGATLNNFLRNESRLEEAIYSHRSGLRIVPASLELSDLTNISTETLKADLTRVFSSYDYVLLDSAPGIGREALIALKACDEAVFVATPHVTSVVDVFKTKNLSGEIGFHNHGIILNRVRNRKYELHPEEVFNFTELPVIASVPEDEVMLAAANRREIPVISYPKSPSSRAFMHLAYKIAGMPYR